METVIPAVDKELLVGELTKDKLLRETNNGSNEIYVITAENSPHVMREIGRLREITFRDAGGGTGKSIDVDEYDMEPHGFKQMIVWDDEEQEIVGGYRYLHGKDIEVGKNNEVKSPTSRLFNFSDKFIKEYLLKTIELGRSFVQPLYQPAFNLRRGMFALDNLWDGLGALIIEHPDIEHLFGKVTMYTDFDLLARDLILFFMQKYFPDHENLVTPKKSLQLTTSDKILNNVFSGDNYDEDYKILVQKVRKLGENIPPLFNAYMNLSSTMKTFGTAVNNHFGDVEETGILITVSDIYIGKKERHVSTYTKPE
ncbi:MAG: hemolysin [Bacteroidetes bacterium]|nr:MAG: hemolysin [Bacteroidota bacterium]